MSIDAARSAEWLKRAALVLLVAYWVGMLVGTHVPRAPRILEHNYVDKLAHLGAYTGLAWLVTLNWSLRRRLSLGHLLACGALLAATAAVDELTQPAFGRTCDAFDWLADVLGIALGVVLFRFIPFGRDD